MRPRVEPERDKKISHSTIYVAGGRCRCIECPSLMTFFQKNMKKPTKLTLHQMWELYILNKESSMSGVVPQSLKMLYPHTDFSKMDIK